MRAPLGRSCPGGGSGGRLVEHLEDPLAAGRRPLGEAEQHAKPLQRPGQQQQVAVEGDQRAERDLAVGGQAPAVPEDRRQAELRQDRKQGVVEGAQPGGAQVLVADGAGLDFQPPLLLGLAPERLDHPHPGGGLLHHRGQVAHLLLHLPVDRVQAAVEAHRPVDQRGPQSEHDQAEPGRQRPHLRGGDREGDQVQDAEHQPPGDEVAQGADVGGRPRQQLAGLDPVVVAGFQRQQVAAEPVAQVVLDVGADPAGEVAPQPTGDPADQRQQQEQGDLAAQHARHPPGQPVVDDRPGHQGDHRDDGHHRHPEGERHRHPPPVGPHQADDPAQGAEGEAVRGRRVRTVGQRATPGGQELVM